MRDALIAEILAETGIVTFQQVRYRLNRSYVAVLSVIAVLIIIILSLLLSLIRYVFCSQPHSQHSPEENDAVGPAGICEIRYDLDDIERMGLLQRRSARYAVSPNSRPGIDEIASSEDLLRMSDQGVRCTNCRHDRLGFWIGGFLNPRSTTVCRECNFVLRGRERIRSSLN